MPPPCGSPSPSAEGRWPRGAAGALGQLAVAVAGAVGRLPDSGIPSEGVPTTALARSRAATRRALSTAAPSRAKRPIGHCAFDASVPNGHMSAAPSPKQGTGHTLASLGSHAQVAARAKSNRLAEIARAVAEQAEYAAAAMRGVKSFHAPTKDNDRPMQELPIAIGNTLHRIRERPEPPAAAMASAAPRALPRNICLARQARPASGHRAGTKCRGGADGTTEFRRRRV